MQQDYASVSQYNSFVKRAEISANLIRQKLEKVEPFTTKSRDSDENDAD